MNCPTCISTMTYDKSIQNKGKWVKDIYYCYACDKYYIDDFLEGLMPYDIIDNIKKVR